MDTESFKQRAGVMMAALQKEVSSNINDATQQAVNFKLGAKDLTTRIATTAHQGATELMSSVKDQASTVSEAFKNECAGNINSAYDFVEPRTKKFSQTCLGLLSKALDSINTLRQEQPNLLLAAGVVVILLTMIGFRLWRGMRRRLSHKKTDEEYPDSYPMNTNGPLDHGRFVGDENVTYVKKLLSPTEYRQEGRSWTSNELKRLYADQEFRYLVKQRGSVPSEFNWQTRQTMCANQHRR